MTTRWQEFARVSVGEDYAETYAARFRAMTDRGEDPHGEARLVSDLVAPPASVLDAGCGTGRVGAWLASQGYDVVGCDSDPAMVDVARREGPDADWRVGDLASLDLGRRFDVVVLAGNVVPFLEPGTLRDVASGLAAHVVPTGLVLAGFGVDASFLPRGVDPVPLADVDAAMASAGLVAGERWSSWDRDPFDPDGGYVAATWRPAAGGDA